MFLPTRMGVLRNPSARGVRRLRRAVRAQGVEGPLAEVVDDWVKTSERKFWRAVKDPPRRAITPSAEKTFFAGIILAGLV